MVKKEILGKVEVSKPISTPLVEGKVEAPISVTKGKVETPQAVAKPQPGKTQGTQNNPGRSEETKK